MAELTVEQHTMLEQYDQLLGTLSDGLEYLENNITEEDPPQIQRAFQDVLLGLEQVSRSHDQMTVLFEELQPLILDFHQVIQLLQDWFKLGTNEEKRQLLVEKVVPSYEEWRTRMQAFVKPYIAH
ncbi:hypothetical protein SAMN05192559_101130 [Halobacillus karajensis]|uniref:DUF8042 domain-containing protein n=1 Tax=Halobacillus karajensis TaxID=195088 RepID=A0A059NV13_9BACI|nr:hypothetical protein [Halobacillus karajensis]CDQ19217.1 hypothetical protein BN982_01502 [Halobacillus karajensis]CDQ22709.1 hypothetical protein BN983_00924 [Halobacillus karajensis]CDQ26191.1 hypothetical protein BN981_00404 [Halobacillus karajensis]SEH39905.1 hypothetical protein SAMN05192559_101130 [Halobacillus karajensis]